MESSKKGVWLESRDVVNTVMKKMGGGSTKTMKKYQDIHQKIHAFNWNQLIYIDLFITEMRDQKGVEIYVEVSGALSGT